MIKLRLIKLKKIKIELILKDLLKIILTNINMNKLTIGIIGNGFVGEAQAFAFLAVRSRLNLPISFPGTTGVNKPLTGGVFHPKN